MLPFPATLHLACKISFFLAGEECTAMGVKADKQKEEWYQSKGTYCTSARTRSPANPKSRAFGSARGLLRRRCRLSIKRWWVGARSTGRSNCSAPTAQPHWSSLCCVADMDVQTVIYICIQNGEVSVGVCTTPVAKSRITRRTKKSKEFFLQGVIIFCTGPLVFPKQLAEIPRAWRR